MMILECPTCETRYRISTAQTQRLNKARCRRCGSELRVKDTQPHAPARTNGAGAGAAALQASATPNPLLQPQASTPTAHERPAQAQQQAAAADPDTNLFKESASIEVLCEHCGTRYGVQRSLFPHGKAKLRCHRCEGVFLYDARLAAPQSALQYSSTAAPATAAAALPSVGTAHHASAEAPTTTRAPESHSPYSWESLESQFIPIRDAAQPPEAAASPFPTLTQGSPVARVAAVQRIPLPQAPLGGPEIQPNPALNADPSPSWLEAHFHPLEPIPRAETPQIAHKNAGRLKRKHRVWMTAAALSALILLGSAAAYWSSPSVRSVVPVNPAQLRNWALLRLNAFLPAVRNAAPHKLVLEDDLEGHHITHRPTGRKLFVISGSLQNRFPGPEQLQRVRIRGTAFADTDRQEPLSVSHTFAGRTLSDTELSSWSLAEIYAYYNLPGDSILRIPAEETTVYQLVFLDVKDRVREGVANVLSYELEGSFVQVAKP